MQLTETELDNILQDQKNVLYDMFNEVVRSESGVERFNYFDTAIPKIKLILQILQFNLKLWNESSYGYKGKEIVHRIEVVCRNERDRLHHAAHAKRADLELAIEKCQMLESFYCSLRGLQPINDGTPPSMVEQVCGVGGGIDDGPIYHETNSLGSQIAAVESGNVTHY